MAKEKWSWIKGYRGLYQYSTLQRVRSIKRVVLMKDGRTKTIKERIKKQTKSDTGHLFVTLYKRGVGKTTYIHQLELERSGKFAKPGQVCRHFPDRNPKNNHYSNISWSSSKQNWRDRIVHETTNRGENNSSSKLTNKQAKFALDQTRSDDMKIADLASLFGVSLSAIADIAHRRTWKHLS